MQASDLMIPIAKCAKVAEDRTIYDALLMLDATRQRSSLEFRPRVVFVHDPRLRVVGCLRPLEVVTALGSVPSNVRSLSWRDIVRYVAETMHGIPVQDVMYRFSEEEYVSEETSLEEVFLRVISGPYTHLVVTSGESTTGVLRLSDIFGFIWKEAKRLSG